MSRHIRVTEPVSGMDCRLDLLDERAPRSAAALWALAGVDGDHEALHAMWTGPEISCPVPATAFPPEAVPIDLSPENATSFPAAGDIAVVWVPDRSFKGQAFAFFDVGLFYGPGARLFMPMGWVMASVCAQVAPEDFEGYRAACVAIRRSGVCRLTFRRST